MTKRKNTTLHIEPNDHFSKSPPPFEFTDWCTVTLCGT